MACDFALRYWIWQHVWREIATNLFADGWTVSSRRKKLTPSGVPKRWPYIETSWWQNILCNDESSQVVKVKANVEDSNVSRTTYASRLFVFSSMTNPTNGSWCALPPITAASRMICGRSHLIRPLWFVAEQTYARHDAIYELSRQVEVRCCYFPLEKKMTTPNFQSFDYIDPMSAFFLLRSQHSHVSWEDFSSVLTCDALTTGRSQLELSLDNLCQHFS